MKKKILFLITKGNWGGAQKYVFDLATNLDKEKFEPVVAHGEGSILPARLAAASIRTIPLTHSKRDVRLVADTKLLFELWQLLWREKPDIVHLNSSKIGVIGALVARTFALLTPNHYPLTPKIIYTVHGWAFNEERSVGQKRIIKFLSWLTIIFCHQVIIINQQEFDQVKNWWGVKNKLVLIYNGVKPINFLPKDKARADLALVGDPIVGTVAELTKNKGLDYLAVSYPQAIIIGEGEERENLERKVKLLGTIPEAAKYLKAFDIFVLPSRKEGLPYSILEAGLAGLPVIASDVGGIPEIIENNVSGLLIPVGDIAKLKQAIEKLIADPALRQKLGSNLQQKIQTKFSFEQMLEKTIVLYK